jgi:hypothetical protein
MSGFCTVSQIKCRYAKCRYAEYHCAECHYAEGHYAECSCTFSRYMLNIKPANYKKLECFVNGKVVRPGLEF